MKRVVHCQCPIFMYNGIEQNMSLFDWIRMNATCYDCKYIFGDNGMKDYTHAYGRLDAALNVSEYTGMKE